jgi:predicted kinase
MELTLHGCAGLARSFAEAYLHLAQDEEGRSLLPFYMAYRAAVRGKVEGMRLGELEIPRADRTAALARARALWLFALSHLESPGGRPCLVIMAGLPGAGKSTLARGLAGCAGMTMIRSDEVRKELAGSIAQDAAPSRFSEGLYTNDWNDRTYAECLRRIEELIFEGKRVLIDATFREDSRRRLFLKAARDWGITGCLLICQADPEVIRSRLDDRRGDASDAGWAIYQEVARSWEVLDPAIRPLVRTINTNGTQAESLAQALDVLQEFGLIDSDGLASL